MSPSPSPPQPQSLFMEPLLCVAPGLGTEQVADTPPLQYVRCFRLYRLHEGKALLTGTASRSPPDGAPQSLLPVVRLSDLLGNPFMQKKKRS